MQGHLLLINNYDLFQVMHVLGFDPHAFSHFRDERKRRRSQVKAFALCFECKPLIFHITRTSFSFSLLAFVCNFFSFIILIAIRPQILFQN